jgi:hypothetical protein
MFVPRSAASAVIRRPFSKPPFGSRYLRHPAVFGRPRAADCLSRPSDISKHEHGYCLSFAPWRVFRVDAYPTILLTSGLGRSLCVHRCRPWRRGTSWHFRYGARSHPSACRGGCPPTRHHHDAWSGWPAEAVGLVSVATVATTLRAGRPQRTESGIVQTAPKEGRS